MLRLGVCATILWLPWLASGCAASAHPGMEAAQQRWEETGRRCRGELLLVGNRPSSFHPPDRALVGGRDDEVLRVQLQTAAEAARRFTVAVRAPSPRSSGSPGAFLQGTGTVIDTHGRVLTNAHVIGAADRAEVFVEDAGWTSATVIGRDAWSDLAVLAVNHPLPGHANLRDAAAVQPGAPIAAVGYPADSRPFEPARVFVGRLRAHDRSLQGALDPRQEHFYAGLLEAAVSLAPGCSGGPLVDADGRVIGICTAAITDGAADIRLGYAIPISEGIRRVIDHLANGCRIEHGYLGILVRAEGATLPGDAAAPSTGAVVERVLADEAAERAGIRPGDIITHVGGNSIQSGSQLVQLVRAKPVGARVDLQIIRNRRPVCVAVTVLARARRFDAPEVR